MDIEHLRCMPSDVEYFVTWRSCDIQIKCKRKQFHLPWVLRCEPVDVSGFRGGLVVVMTVSGSLEGTVDNFMELSDEGLFTSLVVRYRVVLPGLNQPVVVLGTSVDPWGWVVGEVVVVVRWGVGAVTKRGITLLIRRNSIQLLENQSENSCWHFNNRQVTHLFSLQYRKQHHLQHTERGNTGAVFFYFWSVKFHSLAL